MDIQSGKKPSYAAVLSREMHPPPIFKLANEFALFSGCIPDPGRREWRQADAGRKTTFINTQNNSLCDKERKVCAVFD